MESLQTTLRNSHLEFIEFTNALGLRVVFSTLTRKIYERFLVQLRVIISRQANDFLGKPGLSRSDIVYCRITVVICYKNTP